MMGPVVSMNIEHHSIIWDIVAKILNYLANGNAPIKLQQNFLEYILCIHLLKA